MSNETEDPIKPRWTDLIGIDPDYTDGRPVDEWLEANRANPYRLTPAENDISWAGLMELLDEHWPADLFPTLEDDPERDAGARIVSLLRWVDKGKTRIKDDDTTIKRLCWLVSQIEIQRDEARAAPADALYHRTIAESMRLLRKQRRMDQPWWSPWRER